jgi:DNA polymerase III gamma/tau subunit
MPTARLTIAVEGGSDVRRAMGNIVGETRRANAAMNAEARAQSREASRLANEELREHKRALRQKLLEAQRIAREMTQAERVAARARETDNRRAAGAMLAEAKRGERERSRLAAREAALAEKAKRAELTLEQRVQQEKTRIIASEMQKRARMIAAANHGVTIGATSGSWNASMPGGTGGGSGRPAGGGAGGGSGERNFDWRSSFGQLTVNLTRMMHQLATESHQQIQGARARRAGTDATLGGAFYQAGANAGNVGILNQRIHQFASQNGMDSSMLAQAAAQAQTEFSVFGDSRTNDATRRGNLETFLGNASLARDTHQNVGEVTRMAGLLNNAGMDAPTQRRTLLALTGMAQRGAIELGDVTATAMQPIRARMNNSLDRLHGTEAYTKATEDQRSQMDAHAQQQAVMQTMAELEVGRGMGMSPRQLGNVTANMERRFESQVGQDRILNNIQNAAGMDATRRQVIQNALFEDDGHGHQTMRANARSTIGIARALRDAGVDGTTAANLLAGGGAGNAQGAQANERRAIAAYMSQEGQIGRLVSGAGTDFTENDVARGREMVNAQDQTELTRNAETQEDMLRDNTSALTRLSDQLANWQSRNPLANIAGGAIAAGIGGSMISRLGTFGIGAAAPAAGAAAGGGAAAAGGGAAAAGGLGLGGMAALGAAGGLGLAAGFGITRIIDAATSRPGNHAGNDHGWALGDLTSGRAFDGPADPDGPVGRNAMFDRMSKGSNRTDGGKGQMDAAQYAQALRDAFTGRPIQVTIDPASLAHATTVASTGTTDAPGPAGQRR